MTAMISQSARDAAPSNLIATTPMRNTMLGGISDTTLARWMARPELNFPRPIYIGRRRFFRVAEILAWLDAREVQA
ncbi:helix-turn-helix transcriptional regulator [Paenirhodobacter enshiensis]|uniref:helix-turn-helix transcriptional regulator n=1 Tax=Paenirhodobacter enshiensis TaxID=1105367 RepID=UPI0035B13551